MNIVGLMLARNEDWVIGASIRAALEWVDTLVVQDHGSTDATADIVAGLAKTHGDRVVYARVDSPQWDEMEHRQLSLDTARALDATHVAIVDADEIVTANVRASVRSWFEATKPGELVEVPMIVPWHSLDEYRVDDCIWTGRRITLGFCDAPQLCWRPREQGYQHHARPPANHSGRMTAPCQLGGVMHLQFANVRRLRAKHALYKLIERKRWPGKYTVAELNRIYGQALDETGLTIQAIDPSWWAGEQKYIDLHGMPWQEDEVKRLAATQDTAGLDLFGVA